MFLRCFAILIAASAIGAHALGFATSGFGPETPPDLRAELSALAKEIKNVLDKENQTSVAVGQFSGPENIAAQAGPGIQSLLIEALLQLKVRVSEKAELTIKGDYFYYGKPEVKITARIVNNMGETKGELPVRLLQNAADIARLIQTTVSLPSPYEKPSFQVVKHIDDAIENPTVLAVGTKIRAAPKSPYAVEILVKSTVNGAAKASPAKVVRGQAFVAVQKDEFYEVRVFNESKLDAGVHLFLDGIDVFHFSKLRDEKTGKPRYSFFVIPAGKSIDIKGWYRDNSVADSFLVSDYAKNIPGDLHVAGKMGTITVMVKAAWTGDNVPWDERPQSQFLGSAQTDKGPKVAVKLKEVTRNIGAVRDVITIRYDRPNLAGEVQVNNGVNAQHFALGISSGR